MIPVLWTCPKCKTTNPACLLGCAGNVDYDDEIVLNDTLGKHMDLRADSGSSFVAYDLNELRKNFKRS